jgi:hypothetical protein
VPPLRWLRPRRLKWGVWTSVTNPYFKAFDDLGGDLAAKFILQNFNSAEIEQQCSVLI